jgi:hypothetical protein
MTFPLLFEVYKHSERLKPEDKYRALATNSSKVDQLAQVHGL